MKRFKNHYSFVRSVLCEASQRMKHHRCGWLAALLLLPLGMKATTIDLADANGNVLRYYFSGTDGEASVRSLVSLSDDATKAGHLVIPATITDTNGNEHTVTQIYNYAFQNARMKTVVLPETLTEISSDAFYNCDSLVAITIPDGVTTLGSYVFYDCDTLQVAHIGNGITAIPNYTFYECGRLETVTLGSSVTSIGSYAFCYCQALTAIDLRDAVQVLNDGAFEYCYSLASVTGTAAVTTVKTYVFAYCRSLTELTMGEALTSWSYQSPYGSASDYDLSGLQRLTLTGSTNPFTSSSSSHGLQDGLLIYVPADMLETYRADTNLARLRFIALGSTTSYAVTTTDGGQLQEQVEAQVTPDGVLSLTVSGPINGTDIEYIHRYLTNLEELDLNAAQIVNGGDSYHRWQHNGNTATQYGSNSYNTALNTVGDFMFANLPGLSRLVLPADVTAIGAYAFSDCQRLTSLTIPDGVTSIGNYAFSLDLSYDKVNKLKTLHLPASLTTLGKYAFYYQKSLQSIEIPGGVESIPEYCFANCTVQEVTLNEGLQSINQYAFQSSNLQQINLPTTLTTIGYNAFNACPLRGPLTLPAAMQEVGSHAFYGCQSLDNVTFSEGLETIGSYAFYNCRQLKKALLPSTVKTIADNAFRQCYRLEELQLPTGLETMGNYAFQNCDSLATFTFPEAITSVPENVLADCDKLSTVQLASGTTLIGYAAFQSCPKITAFDFSAYPALTQIDNYAFYGTGLVDVELPNQIVLMGQCFMYCKQLKSINVPTATEYVPSDFVNGCTALTQVQLHDGITRINGSAFSECSALQTLDLPDGITQIKSSAFYNCTQLQLDALPSSLQTIESNAFQNCLALTQANLPAGLKTLGSYAFSYSGVREADIPEGITSFANCVFYNCDSLRTVTWPADQTVVPSNTFYSCDSLSTIVLPDNVTEIGTYAFNECFGLKNDFHFPTSLAKIGNYAFRRTRGLSDITLPISLREIGSYAFQGSYLTHIEIPDSVTTLGDYAFQACDSLRTAVLGRSMNYTNNNYFNYFYSCDSLKLVRIFAGTPPTINDDYYIRDYYKNCVLEVPAGVDNLYRETNCWKDFKDILTFLTGDKLDAVDYAILQQLYELWDGANWTHPWDLTTDDRFVGKWYGVTFEGDHISKLDLTNNNLHGPLTQTVFELPALTSLDLGNNYLTGQLETVLADDFTDAKITRVQLYGNQLEGDLAPFAAKFSAITYLGLDYNQLTAISEPISRETLYSVGDNLWYNRQFCDYKTGLPVVSEKYPALEVNFGEPMTIEWNTLQTYNHSGQNYNRDLSYLYHIYRNNNSNWTYDSYYFYRRNGDEWNVSTDYVLYPLRGEPLLLAPSTTYYYQTPIVIQFNWLDGDINADQTVDVADLQHVVSFASTGNKLSGKVFNFTAADAVKDETIDVRDIVMNVNAILDAEEEEEPAPVRAYINYIYTREEAAAQRNVLAIEGDRLRVANTDAVAALQLTITDQQADNLTLSPELRGFALSKRQVGEDTRVVIYNLNGRCVEAGEHDLLTGLDPKAAISTVRLTDAEANYLSVTIRDLATAISLLNDGLPVGAEVFDLSGRRVTSFETAPAGTYVIKQGNKQFKVRK